MSFGTLADILEKARIYAMVPNSSNITDKKLIDLLNSFYLCDFPAQFRSLDLKDVFMFNTIKGIDTYAFDRDHYTTVQEPCYVEKQNVSLFNDRYSFYQYNTYNLGSKQIKEEIAIGNGNTGPYTAILQKTPLLRSISNKPMVLTRKPSTSEQSPSNYPPGFTNANIGRIQNFLITASNGINDTQNITDDGNGILISEAGTTVGSIDYESGYISITFPNSVNSGESIYCLYNPITLSQPLALYFGRNYIITRPVPDRGYIVELTAYRTPSQALLGTEDDINFDGRPEELEWWECLAAGIAYKLYEERRDDVGMASMEATLNKKYDICETRTYAQLGKQRIATIFSGQYDNKGSVPNWRGIG